MINDLFKPDKKEGELELLLEQAEGLAQEADGLQCNVTRDLEKLKASLFLSSSHSTRHLRWSWACSAPIDVAPLPHQGAAHGSAGAMAGDGCYSCQSSRCAREIEGGADDNSCAVTCRTR